MNDNEELSSELQDIFQGDDDGHVLLAESMLGEDCLEFARSDVGRYMIGRADMEIKEATELLKKVLPFRWKRIQQLQNQIKVAENTKRWLLEQIVSGRTAMAEVDRRRTEEGV